LGLLRQHEDPSDTAKVHDFSRFCFSDIKSCLQKLWHELKRCDCTECFQINAKTNAALKLFNCSLLVVPKRSMDMLNFGCY